MAHPRTTTASTRLTLSGLIVIGPLSLATFLPTLPAVQAEFAADIQVVQLTLSLPFLAVVLVPLLAGATSDRIGRRPVLLASLAILLVSSLMCFMAPDIWTLVIGRALVGVAGSCCMIVGRAVVTDLYSKDDLARAMAHYTVAPVVALMVAPTIGGFLTDGFGWRSVFVVLSVATGVVVAMTWRLMRETGAAATAKKSRTKTDFAPLLRSVEMWGFTFFSAFHFAVTVGFIAAAPYLMVNMMQRTATEYGIGLVFVIGGMLAGIAVASRIPSRIGIATVVLGGAMFALLAGLTLPLALAFGLLTPFKLFVPTAFVAFGIGVAMPAGQAGIVGAFPPLAGTASGISGFLQMLFAAIFAHVVAFPWDHPDRALAMVAVGGLGLSVIFALVPLAVARRRVGEPS